MKNSQGKLSSNGRQRDKRVSVERFKRFVSRENVFFNPRSNTCHIKPRLSTHDFSAAFFSPHLLFVRFGGRQNTVESTRNQWRYTRLSASAAACHKTDDNNAGDTICNTKRDYLKIEGRTGPRDLEGRSSDTFRVSLGFFFLVAHGGSVS